MITATLILIFGTNEYGGYLEGIREFKLGDPKGLSVLRSIHYSYRVIIGQLTGYWIIFTAAAFWVYSIIGGELLFIGGTYRIAVLAHFLDQPRNIADYGCVFGHPFLFGDHD